MPSASLTATLTSWVRIRLNLMYSGARSARCGAVAAYRAQHPPTPPPPRRQWHGQDPPTRADVWLLWLSAAPSASAFALNPCNLPPKDTAAQSKGPPRTCIPFRRLATLRGCGDACGPREREWTTPWPPGGHGCHRNLEGESAAPRIPDSRAKLRSLAGHAQAPCGLLYLELPSHVAGADTSGRLDPLLRLHAQAGWLVTGKHELCADCCAPAQQRAARDVSKTAGVESKRQETSVSRRELGE